MDSLSHATAKPFERPESPTLPVRSLSDFWPNRGPVWDAVAKVGTAASLFVEAKAHIAEAASPPSKATPASLAKIERALAEARAFYAPDSTADWHRVFYQYANRLAHHYLLAHINGNDSRLGLLVFSQRYRCPRPNDHS